MDRYLHVTGDRSTLRQLIPTLRDIIDHHLRGTRFGIHVDPRDGLLCQGEAGYQLTWMDAKVGDWVVTPRRGKAVEINALWYNAVHLLAGWLAERGQMPKPPNPGEHAASVPMPRSTPGSGTPRKVSCTTSSMAKAPTIRRCGPTNCSRFRCRIPCWIKARWPAVMRHRGRAAAHAHGTAHACTRRARLSSRNTTATAVLATPPIIRGPSGRGWSGRWSMPG